MGWIAILFAVVGVVGWFVENARRKTYPVSAGHHPEIQLPFEEEFELYHNALSLCSMKTRVCLSELRIQHKSHHIDLIETGSYENIRPSFLAVNPGGTVPVLVHNGHPVYESHEQIRYAAEHAPAGAPNLVPEDPDQRERMDEWIDRSSIGHDPINHGDESAGNAIPGLTLPIFSAMIDRIATWKIIEGALSHFDKIRPAVFLLLKVTGLERLGKLSPAMKVYARSRKQMGDHLDALEEQLREGGGPWILGDLFSLADVSWLVIFERLRQVDSLPVFLGKGERPKCNGYWERLQKRPSYQQAIVEHSHPTIEYGTRRLIEAKAKYPSLRLALDGSE